uniref:Serine/threonine-protein kinase greatwall n=1 Tax=Cercocebus atys TaxID=9531 RepID=A0A2K5NCL0_CERAT
MEPTAGSKKEAGGGAATEEGVNRISVPKPPSIEEFSIVKPISRGAFGKVYLGQKGGKLYAVKVVKKADMINKNMTHQVQAERDALALSKSPFIVHLYYSLQSANNVYLVMEYLIGGDVKSLLHIYGYFDEEMAVKYISEVALALDYLHRHGIIHRDLKPDNMLISNEGHIKLTDFGLSKVTLNRDINMMVILTTPSMNPRTSVIAHQKNHDSANILSACLSETSQLSEDSYAYVYRSKDTTSYSSKLLKSCLETVASNPGMPVKCLTSNLLQSRKRLATSSASSQSHTFISSVESECHSSPKWEKDCQENDEALGPTVMSWNTVEKLCAKSPNAIETKGFNKKDLELALSPIHNSSALPTTGRSCVNLAKNCLSGEVSWEAVELDVNNINMDTDTRQSGFHQSHQWAVDSGGISEEHLGKRSLKRNFDWVDSSPCKKIIQNKKTCVEYKHNEMIDCYTNQNTGLTVEVHDLKLSVHKSQQNDCANKENIVNSFTDKQQTPEKLPIPMIAKNLMCELDEDCENNSKRDYLGSSFLCSDDDRASKNISMNSDSSFPGISIMESPLESQPLDPDRSMKESSFEESNIEDPLIVSPNCQEKTSPKGDENPAVQESNQKMLAPPLEVLKTLASKRNAVAFRSFNSHINASNNSEPSKMNMTSLDAMDISCAYSGSYPMAVTPTQKRRSCMPYQTPNQIKSGTPYRTPKSVRRGAAPVDDGRILGTPDYLAPELLLGRAHGPAVDWWALGVCLFEFLTGIPPFNDETPQQVFQNILKRDIPWPEGEEKLSDNAQSAVEILLTIDDTKRAGMKELKRHPLFSDVDWENVQHQTMPFIPQPDDETDTSYFEARNTAQHLTVSGFSL